MCGPGGARSWPHSGTGCAVTHPTATASCRCRGRWPARPGGQQHRGLQTIPVHTIIGTVDPQRGFDRHFRPTTNRVRSRWQRLALAQRRGAPIPPIDVYRVGDGIS